MCFIFIAIAVSIGELGLAGAMNSMLAAAGIGTLALGIGAQSLIGDIVTGMFLLFEDQLSVGDYVSIGGVEGTVEEMTLRTVTLQGWRGEKTMIPNGQVKTVVNYSRRDYLAVVEMNIAQEADADRAMAIMHEELEKVIASFGIEAPIQDWGVVAENADSSDPSYKRAHGRDEPVEDTAGHHSRRKEALQGGGHRWPYRQAYNKGEQIAW